MVIIVPVMLLRSYAIGTFDKFTRTNLEKQMLVAGFVAGEQFKAAADSAGNLDESRRGEMTRLIDAYAREAQMRIQVLSSNGVVLADSEGDNCVGSSLGAKSEVQIALGGRRQARWMLTDDRKFVYYYYAIPVHSYEKVLGVIYVSCNTASITQAIKDMVRFQNIMTSVAIVIGTFLAALLAYSITRRLGRLTAAAREFSQGRAPLKVTVRGKDEVGELAAAINTMADEIGRTNRYNREFISTVMHELKMPVTAIKGAAELLEQGAFDKSEAREKFLGNIRFEADRLARLIWELNELTKLDTEGLHAQKEKMDYCECVRDIVDRFKMTLDPPYAEITLSLPDRKLAALINVGRIEQVICNLLDNAVRYTPATGSIEVKVVAGEDGAIVTSVRDTGCGISPSNIGKIFDKFFTTEPKGKPKDYGSGLGLAIAKSIVENHQGRIWVESKSIAGTVFFFSLPVAE